MQKHMKFLPTLVWFAALTFVACQPVSHAPVYTIGVSQCCDDIWRQKMNRELDDELVFHPDVRLSYRQANDNSALQCRQIDSFIAERVDMLIVSPNESQALQSAVERAYDAGIPVLLADRRIPGNKWTAYVGGDNRQVGVQLAGWLKTQRMLLGHPVRAIEVTGSMTSSPALLRHEGLTESLRGEPDIHIVASHCGNWTQADAEHLCDSLLVAHSDVDVIVTQNDMMAFGAADAVERHGLTIPVIGVDGISGENGGIEAVLKGRIAATVIYPSRGDIVLQRAVQILHGDTYQRETNLLGVLVNGSEEARPVAMMYAEHEAQMAALLELRKHMSNVVANYHTQRTFTVLLVSMLFLLIAISISIWKIYHYRLRISRQQLERDQMLLHQQQLLAQITHDIEQSTVITPASSQEEDEQRFVETLSAAIRERMSNPNLKVESLAEELGYCRSVLFRKTKAATGLSPVELIRTLRLRRADQLLKSGQMTVQQVAYEVGFSSPTYFARCYKEEFGNTPGDSKK